MRKMYFSFIGNVKGKIVGRVFRDGSIEGFIPNAKAELLRYDLCNGSIAVHESDHPKLLVMIAEGEENEADYYLVKKGSFAGNPAAPVCGYAERAFKLNK